jgi:hypothetical protein
MLGIILVPEDLKEISQFLCQGHYQALSDISRDIRFKFEWENTLCENLLRSNREHRNNINCKTK